MKRGIRNSCLQAAYVYIMITPGIEGRKADASLLAGGFMALYPVKT